MKTAFHAACLAAVCLSASAQESPSGIEFTLQGPPAASMPKDTSAQWLELAGLGTASGGIGVAAGPMYGAGMVVGAILLVPASLTLSSRERAVWEQVAEALRTAGFEQRLLGAARRRAAEANLQRPLAAMLTVHGYGLAGTGSQRACFFAEVELSTRLPGQDATRHDLRISRVRPSPDAPPGQCAELERFAEQKGQLVRDVALEAAEVLAAMAVARIGTGGQ